ncbi:hypothetical protein [Schlesneria paludicola]|uniref:hypothetical protein n=1 Tax=Schlesneria paludicola TaxID=360056 RepID=UPI00029A87A9|nr:hypothetical protein [Schlesneria paludicola]
MLVFLISRWKLWTWSRRTWISVFVATSLTTPFVTRWICLWQIPDVELPFDVESNIREAPPTDDDALVRYRNAARMLSQLDEEDVEPKWFNLTRPPYGAWDDRIVQPLKDRHQVLSELACLVEMGVLRDFSQDTFSEVVDTFSDFRRLARFSEATAIWRARCGQNEDAWACHRASLRIAMHADQPGWLLNALIGQCIRGMACDGIRYWAAGQSVTAPQLRNARRELEDLAARRLTILHIVKAEYVFGRNFVMEGNVAEIFWPDWTIKGPLESRFLACKRVGLWFIGQPELTLRLARQQLVNITNECDKPISVRQPSLRSDDYILFKDDGVHPTAAGQLNSAALDRALNLVLATQGDDPLFFKSIKGLIQNRDRENARIALVSVVLAAHEFHRVYGTFPKSLDQLVPGYLDEIPIDPLDCEGRPLNFRYDDSDNAFVWSVGLSGQDRASDFEDEAEQSRDFGLWIRLRTPVDCDEGNHTTDDANGAASTERLLLDRENALMNSLFHPKE